MDLPRFSISELNAAIGVLLERGFVPRFLLEARVVKPQVRKGHLWMILSDGDASIGAVVWASTLAKLSLVPEDGDGVIVVGKLNFWPARATLSVQVLDLRPSLSTVLRRFEQVRDRLEAEGLLDPDRRRPLPELPRGIALLTASPSSALADLLRTAGNRWPACDLLVLPIPVQGPVEGELCALLERCRGRWQAWGVEVVVLARGGGNREDLALFDGEELARELARLPVPLVTGIGHEDDLTVADLIADLRAATPTAAVVAVLPDRLDLARALEQRRQQRRLQLAQHWQRRQRSLAGGDRSSLRLSIRRQIERMTLQLQGQCRLLGALEPTRQLQRGYAVLRQHNGTLVRSGEGLPAGERIRAQLATGTLHLAVEAWQPEQRSSA
jgi:exodeoxyribonuclease VII large subunit